MILGYGFSVVVGKRKYYPVSSLEIQGGKTFRTVAVTDGRDSTPNIIPATTYSVPFAVADGRDSTRAHVMLDVESWPSATANGTECFATRPRVQMSARKRLPTKYPMYLDDGTVV